MDEDGFILANIAMGMFVIFPVAFLAAIICDWLWSKVSWYELLERSIGMVKKLNGSRNCPSCGQYINREGAKESWDPIQVCKICGEIVCQRQDCLTAHVIMRHTD